jgi:membrane-associated phospholipid phosphatase
VKSKHHFDFPMKNRAFFTLIFVIMAMVCFASEPIDSALWRGKCRSEWNGIVFLGVPVTATGLITKALRTDYSIAGTGNDNFNAFNIIQYAPVATMLGLKIAGEESRSSWGRMLTSDAFSTAIMLAAVKGLKKSCDEQRPDGYDFKSFPSGHAAVAFMTATMMAREYGWKSPWYSVGSYAIASATSVSRMIADKHWAGDVVTGAGIGILSTQLGYFIGDMIFGGKGLSKAYISRHDDNFTINPSYISINSALAIPLNNLSLSNGQRLKLGAGTQASISGDYRINDNWGVFTDLNLTSMSLSVDDASNTYIDPINSLNVTIGPSMNASLGKRTNCMVDIGIGCTNYFKLKTANKSIGTKSTSLSGTLRAGIGYEVFNDFRVKAFAQYSLSRLGIDVSADNSYSIPASNGHCTLGTFAIGFSSDVTF